MNILVTGANGLLGASLVERLAMEHTVYVVVKDITKFSEYTNVICIKEDLLNLDMNILPNNIDAVYYLAQSNQFRSFPQGAKDMLEINVSIPLEMINWAKDNSVRKFIYASSGGVYSDTQEVVKEGSSIDAHKVEGFYLNSKLSAEILLKSFAAFFETFVIIRPFFIYGEGQNANMLIPRLIHNVKEGIPIQLSSPEGIYINPIYSGDASASIAKLLEIKGEYIINIAGEEVVSLKALVLIIEEITGAIAKFAVNEKNQNNLIADISMMKEYLCSPTVSLKDGLTRVIESL